MDYTREKQILNGKWGYIILLCKFVMMVLTAGTSKSFGVLIPDMVDRLGGSYATIGLVCTLPETLMLLSSPFTSFILVGFNRRLVAILGGTINGISCAAAGVVSNVPALGMLLTLAGIGRSCVYYALTLALKEYFPESFVLMNTLSLYGLTIGVIFLPVITERSLEAYGYAGAFLILGGMGLHLAACGAAIRKPVYKEIDHVMEEHCQGEHIQKEEAGEIAEVEMAVNAEKRKTDSHGEEGQTQDRMESGTLEEHNTAVKGKPFNSVDKGGSEKYTESKFPEGNGSRGQNIEENHPLILDSDMSDNNDDASDKEQAANKRHRTRSFKSILEQCRQSSIFQEPLHLLSLPILFCVAYTTESWLLFLVPHAEQLGIAQSKAVFLSSIAGIGGIVGRTLLISLLAKKVDIFNVYMVVGSINASTFFLDDVSKNFIIRASLAFVQGVCLFIQDSTVTAMLKQLLVHESSFILSLTLNQFIHGSGFLCGGFITGTLIDVIHSYTKVFYIIGCTQVFFVVNVILVKVLLKRRN